MINSLSPFLTLCRPDRTSYDYRLIESINKFPPLCISPENLLIDLGCLKHLGGHPMEVIG